MASPITPYYAPQPPVPSARQAECLAFAAHAHGRGFWSYIAQFDDVTAFAMKGWPDAQKWLDLPRALIAAGETMALVAELARHRGDEQLRRDLRVAIKREAAKAGSAPTAGRAGR